jgi:large subunit ribosomal protein L21
VIELSGSQTKCTPGDVIVSEKLLPLSLYRVGAEILMTDNILLVGTQEKTTVGLPHCKGFGVRVRVEEITRDATVIIFKKRRRKNSKRRNGFRREVTVLRVLDIVNLDGVEETPVV